MADAITVSAPISGTDKSLTFETGKLALQSQGAVVASIAGTEALVTTNAAKGVREGIDFFPLTVDVEERMYAAGRIPGSFFRREGRPTDAAILACRLIDRPLRPSFADGFRNETQVVVTVIGHDQENPYDVLAINGASASLMISGIPFQGPIGAVRIAYSTDGTWIPHPTFEEVEESTFELIVAGRGVGDDVAIMMVEAGGTEKAWSHYEAGAPKVTEEVIADGLDACKVWIKESIELQKQLVSQVEAGRGITPLAFTPMLDYGDDVYAKVEALVGDDLAQAGTIAAKAERNAATDAAIATALESLGEEFAGRHKEIKEAARSIQKAAIRARTVNEGIRIDGRAPADLRTVTSEVGVLGTAHGSGLFQRGETQVLSVLALGMPKMDQLLDNLGDKAKKRYMHHYNMPPHANGETGRVGSPKRREVGHGLLAERALLPVVPSLEEWAYTLRVVSEVLSSNGSTSMGSVCGSTLALMDGGVPIKAPVAGIAMGLVKEGDDFVVLSDILGDEDHLGDMDFKVAGTSNGVSALQMDIKIEGITEEIMKQALAQAKAGRLHILGEMAHALTTPRQELSEFAPRLITIRIHPDKIREVIGKGGAVIQAITKETGTQIDIQDDGTITIASVNGAAGQAAKARIEQITSDIEPGRIYEGKVAKLMDFGAFVTIAPGKDGLVHVSQISVERVEKVSDKLKEGDLIRVKVLEVDKQGRIRLSMKAVEDGEGMPVE
ncbi:MAG: polyribonucleotide nucleotidyltransferase [Acidimicrobiales bacterium]